MTTQIQKAQPPKSNPLAQLRTDLNQMLPQFKMALPENVTPEKFVRVILTAVQNTPALMNCDRQTLFGSAMKCAQDGLLPDGREAAFIPYGASVQYQPMVGGIYKKIRNSKEIAFICADVVYTEDEFKFWTDENGRHIEHKPKLSGARGRSDNVVAVFSLAKTKDGDVDFEVMTREEVEFVRSKSKSANSPAWKDWWGEMAKKTVVKRLAKRLPTSADVQTLIDNDNENEGYDLNASTVKTKADELSDKLSAVDFTSEGIPEDKGDFENFNEGPAPIETTAKRVEDPKVVK